MILAVSNNLSFPILVRRGGDQLGSGFLIIGCEGSAGRLTVCFGRMSLLGTIESVCLKSKTMARLRETCSGIYG